MSRTTHLTRPNIVLPFLRYHERALGALQAMVELNVTPRDSPVSVDDLEEFWESEAARVGDAHPSLAGISWWRKASATARNDIGGNDSREGDIEPGGKRAVRGGVLFPLILTSRKMLTKLSMVRIHGLS